MINNDVLRSVRYMLDLPDTKVIDIIALANSSTHLISELNKESILNFIKKETEEGFVHCHDEILAGFLDGLIIFKRGKKDNQSAPPPPEKLSNNVILKKLRVAFELKEDDMHAIMLAAQFQVSKPELSALFRKEGQKNYRPCGDQFLRNFLKGLTLHIRG